MNIEFIIPTWKRPENLKVILQSLVVQTNPNWLAHVIIDGMTNEYFQVKNIYQDENRIRFSHIEGPHNDWGHTGRNYGLDKAIEEWIVMSGDDNYYAPTFVENFLHHAVNQTDFVFCNMVHDMKRDDYQPIPCKIQLGWIDIGNFMSRKSVIGDLRIDPKDYNGDWEFIRRYQLKSRQAPTKIDKILYVHN